MCAGGSQHVKIMDAWIDLWITGGCLFTYFWYLNLKDSEWLICGDAFMLSSEAIWKFFLGVWEVDLILLLDERSGDHLSH